MRIASEWKDFELLDTNNGERLERWGDIILIRPDPQVIWGLPRDKKLWSKAHARFLRKGSGGEWEIYKDIPDSWQINYKNCKFNINPKVFKHTGLFPEQAVNWDFVSNKIKESKRQLKVLNLFAYTGAATVNALLSGANVVHVDAAKGSVQSAKENAKASLVNEKLVRWIVDDCLKFVLREKRRGNTYDIILMDPPSFGRGPSGEVWKFEDEIFDFCKACIDILSDKPVLLMINSYTGGLSPSVMEYMLSMLMKDRKNGRVCADEIGLKVSKTNMILPCGSTSYWESI